ncbi:MAG: NAD(P)-dependent oxidoreductase, partial [Pseudomonadota bacterium]|nr:NAD(P)-dependent oxidoreductase [Pseudomonadota bacterium]
IAFSDTKNEMIGTPFLQSLKLGAILVSTARGSVVDDVALVEVLKTGPLGHAALDVYTVEPLESESPLRSMQNVTLSAHAAWETPDAADRLMKRGLEILQDDIASL